MTAASAAVIGVMELLDALRLKGLEGYEDAVADAVAGQRAVGVPHSKVYDAVRAAGVGARKAMEFATFIETGEYKTAAAAASVVRVDLECDVQCRRLRFVLCLYPQTGPAAAGVVTPLRAAAVTPVVSACQCLS